MNLELLPNEILLYLFEYFDGIDLLRTFYGLNFRFNYLLYKQFRAYYFNFSCWSKRNFDMICQQHLPFMADQVISLYLPNSNHCPEQINLFLSYIPSFSQFTHLRFLKMSRVSSYETLITIADKFHYLCNLTHLILEFCVYPNDQADFQLIVNNIWSLPKLTHFVTQPRRKQTFFLSTKRSTCLKNVTTHRFTVQWKHIYQLFENTPYLQRLSISIKTDNNEHCKLSPLPLLINLTINIYRISDTSNMIFLLQNVPNLRRLNISLYDSLVNGYQWEQLIRNYLPKLEIFQFRMNDELPVNQNMEERADELINSFRSSFWIDEHKWFVRCFTCDKTIYLETLFKTFDYFEKKLPDSWRSTYPYDDHQKFYNTINLIYDETFFDQPIPSYICLHNLEFLFVRSTINDPFRSVVPSLQRLNLLCIFSHCDTSQSQWQTLLDSASRLYHLHIIQDKSLPLQTSLFKYTHASIRQLHLNGHYFNEEECVALSHSPLGIQCEVLSIQVENHENIVILIQNMSNLRAIHVECENIKDSAEMPANTTMWKRDEIIEWLKDRLSSTCLISKDPSLFNCIRIWIQ